MALPQNKYSLSSPPQSKNRKQHRPVQAERVLQKQVAALCPWPRNHRPAIFKAMCSDIGFADLQRASLTFELPVEKVSKEPEGPYVKQAFCGRLRWGSEEGPGMTIT